MIALPQQIDFSGLLSLPDGGIVLSYGLVVVFGVGNGLLAKKAKLPWIRNQSFAIAAIFLACVTSYIFHAVHAPQSWIQFEHYFVAALGTTAAISLFPLSAKKFIQAQKDKTQKAALLTALDDTSTYPKALLQWHSTEKMTVLYLNRAMVDFFVDNDLAQRHEAVAGADWYDLFRQQTKPWREKDKAIAHGKTYKDQLEIWERGDKKNVYFRWSATPVYGEGLPPLTWAVEWSNPYDLYKEIDELRTENSDLKTKNHYLIEELESATQDSYKDIAKSLDELNKIIEPE